jgi:RAT1-interacting protein
LTKFTDVCADLKATITTEGVWRIRRKERSPVIEVFKVEKQGTGQIILQDFIAWRERLMAKEVAELLK